MVPLLLIFLLASWTPLCRADDPPGSNDNKTATFDDVRSLDRIDCCQVYPNLSKWGRAGVAAVRHLALNMTVQVMTTFRSQYIQARRSVEGIMAAGTFDAMVNTLIPMLDHEATMRACVLACHAMARYTTDHINHDIADFVCLALCRGGLTKVRQAAQTLETELKAIDQVIETPGSDILPGGDKPVVDPLIDQPIPPAIDVNIPGDVPSIDASIDQPP